MSEKHTPGPWTAWEHGDSYGVYSGVEKVGRGSLTGKNLVTIAELDGDDADECAIAPNARLVSTAPDGLALARMVVEYASRDAATPNMRTTAINAAARALIAKYEGRS